MVKKIFRVILVLVIVLGVAFSISNFFPKTADAVMTEELLHWFDLGDDGYAYYCEGEGQGCYTVIEEI